MIYCFECVQLIMWWTSFIHKKVFNKTEEYLLNFRQICCLSNLFIIIIIIIILWNFWYYWCTINERYWLVQLIPWIIDISVTKQIKFTLEICYQKPNKNKGVQFIIIYICKSNRTKLNKFVILLWRQINLKKFPEFVLEW